MKPTVEFWRPAIVADGSNVTYDPEGMLQMTQQGLDFEFNFTVEANGGYWELGLNLGEQQPTEVEWWLENGLGLHVNVLNDAQIKIWEGFVNRVDGNTGALSVTRGPLTEICNRASVKYAKQERDGLGEIVTTQGLTTVLADDDDSKLAYGLFEKIFSAGTTWDDTEADWLRDTALAEKAWPETTKRFSLGAGNTSISLSCLGYIHYLKNFIILFIAAADDMSTPIYDVTDADSKLRRVLEEDTNGLFDDDTLWDFDDVLIDVPLWEDQETDAYTLIRSMVDRGDGAGGRMMFSVYADRALKFKPIPTTFDYQQALADPGQKIRTWSGAEVEDWDVLPGKWLLFTDFLIGREIPSALHEDPRALFIERVAFSTPDGLQLDGGKVHTFAQRLADFGLGM